MEPTGKAEKREAKEQLVIITISGGGDLAERGRPQLAIVGVTVPRQTEMEDLKDLCPHGVCF